jgi:plastocyanin
VVIVLVVLGLATSGCSSSSSSASKRTAIKNFTFLPHALVVKLGDTVTVANHDSSLHGVLADNQTFAVRSISPGLSQRFTMTTPGTFTYHCTFHTSMTGVITVRS